MTFPTTRSDQVYTQGTNSTSWSFDLSTLVIRDGGGSQIVAGDLILINIGRDGATGTGSITGYNLIFNAAAASSTARGLTFVRVATAGDASSPPTLSYAPGASEQGVARVAIIKDWYGSGIADGTGVHVSSSTGATGTSANPDPDNCAPSWAGTTVDTYWRAVCAYDDGRPTATTFPTNYTIFTAGDASGGSGGAGLGSAGRQNAVASEDAGAFTLTGTGSSTEWVAWSIAIRPAVPPDDPTPKRLTFPQLLAQ